MFNSPPSRLAPLYMKRLQDFLLQFHMQETTPEVKPTIPPLTRHHKSVAVRRCRPREVRRTAPKQSPKKLQLLSTLKQQKKATVVTLELLLPEKARPVSVWSPGAQPEPVKLTPQASHARRLSVPRSPIRRDIKTQQQTRKRSALFSDQHELLNGWDA